ncbi:MAG: immunoglobulin-like domain-containing protein [Arcobacter sp.]|uniref:immunoglobulin-like domain-containing protein n=1 Tax=Arcobacter sp. TaxID=1872629 RepID=UPI003D0D2F0A
MAGEIGKIISLNGSFFIKHPNGSVSTAKVNDILNDGDIIIGSSSNTNSNMLKVLLSDNSGDIQVVGNNEQLFDVTLLSGELPEDTVVQNNEVSDLLEQSTKNIQENPAQTDEQATLTLDQIEKLDAAAAGEDQTTTDPVGIIPLRLEDRTAGETNITTDLRDAVSTTTIVDDTVTTNNTILVDATLTLTDTTILEGNENATVSASLDQTPRTTLIVTLSNGATITFGTDYVPGTLVESTSFPIQGDDVYIDAEAYTVSGTSYVGGGFNSIVGYPSTVTISDTNDTVTATLTSSLATGSNEDAGSITYTITLTNADGLPVAPTAVAGETFSFTLNDGTEVSVVVPQNGTTGSTTLNWSASASDFTALANADVFSDTTTVSLNGIITSTNNSGYENLVTAGTSSHTVVDTNDTVTATLTSSLATGSNEDAGSITYTITLTNADGLPVAPTAVAGETFSFTLNDGTEVSVVVPQNGTTGSTTLNWSASASDFTALANADVFSDTTTVSLNGIITSTNNSGYENLVTAGTSSHTVVDSEDTTILKVNESLNSDGSYTYTAVVSNAPDTGNNLVITLDNGKTIILDSSVITASVNSDTQALSVTSVTGGNYEDLKVVYGFGQDIIMKIAANNSLDDVDTNTSYFDSDTINTEIALSSIKLTPQVDVNGYAININGDRITSTDNIGTSQETTYYIKYDNSNPDNITAYRVSSSGTEYTSQIVFTISSDTTNENYSITLGTYPLDGAAYTMQNIFESSSTSYNGGNELSLLFNVNDLYVLASATSDTGVAGSGNNAYQVNYSTGNGLGVDDAGTIGTDEKLYLNFTNSTMSSNLLLGGNGNDTDGNDNTITDSVDNRTYAQNNEQYLTNAIFSLQKWQSGDQAIWQAFNGTVLIAEGTKDYVANDSTLAVSSEVSNINITTSGITWSMYDNVLTNDSGSAQTADVSYTINEGTTPLSTTITLDAGESFNFNAFNEIQFTAGSGDYSLSSMSASNTESIPPENQVINVGIDTYINGTEHSSGVMQITFDGDGAIVGTSESEVIDYTDVTSIDGGDGIDTLVLSGNESIDFSSIPDNSIVSIEHIDLTADGAQSVSKLTLSDVVDLVPNISGITDTATNISSSDHLLKITGDGEDSVSLLNTTESWTKASSTYTDVDSIVYDVFSNNEDSSYKVLIQQNVQDTITNS